MTKDRERIAERERMVDEIRALVRTTERETGLSELPAPVLEAVRRVPRHRFVPARDQVLAYADMPLPIGEGQTISQPYMVAVMTALLEVGAGDKVLEVGTGCGYQTAVLAELVAQVLSLEVVPRLAAASTERLADLGYPNAVVQHGDGYAGWPDAAPFDGIIVTAAAPEVPETLVDQLRSGGNLVIPVARGHGQQLCVLTKREDGSAARREVLPVAFVPMVRS